MTYDQASTILASPGVRFCARNAIGCEGVFPWFKAKAAIVREAMWIYLIQPLYGSFL
jgi:hypothetical protein